MMKRILDRIGSSDQSGWLERDGPRAVLAAILLIYRVIRSGGFPEPRNYALAFTFSTAFFLFAGIALLFVDERPSESPARRFNLIGNLRYSVQLARENPNLARLMVVNMAVGALTSMLQFYTLYWREAGTMTAGALVLATVIQVFWQSLSSSILGRVADRLGNRVVVYRLLWVEALIPLVALALGGFDPFRGHWGWYMGVYALVGFRFPLFQLLVNYLLEIVPQRDHAMALGAVTTVQLITAPAPLLFGGLARAWGFPAAFLAGAAIGIYGCIVARGLEEVRVK